MKILIVSEGFNRKNGGNGSFLDMARIFISLKYKVYLHPTKRNWLLYIIEILLCVFDWKVLKARYIKELSIKDKFDYIFISPAIDQAIIHKLRLRNINSKLVTIQTGDIPKGNDFIQYNIDRSVFDYIFFQSERHFKNYKLAEKDKKMPKPILTYASTNEARLKFFKMLKINSNVRTIVCCGSIQPRKNQINLAKYFDKYIKASGKNNVQLLFIGPTLKSHKEYTNKFIEIIKDKKYIRYLGNRFYYPLYMASSDMMLIGSLNEGLSTIIRESIFYNKIICSTNIDGSLGLLSNNNSFIVNKNNLEAELRSVFDQVFTNNISLKDKLYELENTYDAFISEKNYTMLLESFICNNK